MIPTMQFFIQDILDASDRVVFRTQSVEFMRLVPQWNIELEMQFYRNRHVYMEGRHFKKPHWMLAMMIASLHTDDAIQCTRKFVDGKNGRWIKCRDGRSSRSGQGDAFRREYIRADYDLLASPVPKKPENGQDQ